MSSNPNATSFACYDNFDDQLAHVELFPMFAKELTPVYYGRSFSMHQFQNLIR